LAKDVKWLKLMNDIFEDEKIEYIESLPDGEMILLIWIKILCLASKSNENGNLMITSEIPYTSALMAHKFKKSNTQIEYALKVMQQLGMLEINDDIICVSNWCKYQNTDELAKIREQTRLRVAKHRENKKLSPCNDTVTLQCNENALNSISISLSNSISSIFEYWKTISNKPNIILTDKRTKAIQKSLKTYTEEEIKSCIDRYWKALRDERYFFDYEWDIDAFLTRQGGIAHFTEDGEKWKNYLKEIEKKSASSSDTHQSIANIDENDEFLDRILRGR
jgi:predicted phage replisome organizer